MNKHTPYGKTTSNKGALQPPHNTKLSSLQLLFYILCYYHMDIKSGLGDFLPDLIFRWQNLVTMTKHLLPQNMLFLPMFYKKNSKKRKNVWKKSEKNILPFLLKKTFIARFSCFLRLISYSIFQPVIDLDRSLFSPYRFHCSSIY